MAGAGVAPVLKLLLLRVILTVPASGSTGGFVFSPFFPQPTQTKALAQIDARTALELAMELLAQIRRPRRTEVPMWGRLDYPGRQTGKSTQAHATRPLRPLQQHRRNRGL